MNALTENVQLIMENGAPMFAVIPYPQYKKICSQLEGGALQPDEVPHEVVAMMVEKHYSAVKAWRVYLRMSQKDAAAKIGITQAALSQMEKTEKLQPLTARKIANSWGISVEQLEL